MRIRVEELFHAVADLTPEARARFFAENQVDPMTQREVERLVVYDLQTATAMEKDIGSVALEAIARVGQQGCLCGPYRLGTILGRGGMGTVYAAERVDGEVRQKVAVKLLRYGADDPQLCERFLVERQILAGLSHANIARLLDAGRREDGQPYLVMERVEGVNIDLYCAGLSIRQKISLFLKVCAAVSHLHRNLVVHRDLKPGNILVNSEGEPKLLDFGIAKSLELTGDSTVTSMRMLTPDYASPEQVTGGAITTASDIYSLGAILYKLVTGVLPSSGRIGRLRRAPNLKDDLEIVLMKALRAEPQERYGSVDAFADDLRACMERRPVQARAGNAWYRARKLLRYYWVPATAAALVMLSLSTGLYVANRQRMIAERRFGQLRQLSNRVIDLDRAIRRLPGSVEARQRLVAVSLEYLQGLSWETHGDLELTRELAEGYWRMARIQGVNAEFNLGESGKAEESLKHAEVLIETVLASRPRDRGALFRSALIAHDRMIIAVTEDRRADVVVYGRQAEERLERFLRDKSQSPIRMDGLVETSDARQSEAATAATLYVNFAVNYINVHLYEDTGRCARQALELAKSFASSETVAIQALSLLANALRYQGDLDGALSAIRQARKLAEQAIYPTDEARVFKLFGPIYREGLILGEPDMINLGRPAEAIEALQRALNITEQSAAKDSNDMASRIRLADAAWNLGDLLRESDPRRALSVYDLGIRRVEEMRNNLQARRYHGALLAKSAYVLRRLHRFAEAKERIGAAGKILEDTHDYPVERIRLDDFAYVFVCAVADHDEDMGDPRRALETYEELLRKVERWPPQPYTSLPDAVSLSRLYSIIAGLDHRAGQNDRASGLESRRLELWRHWNAKLPNNSFIQGQLAAATRPASR
jgi:serine/threonine-protein kinase